MILTLSQTLNRAATMTPSAQTITPLERALVRRLTLGHSLEETAASVGLSLPEAAAVLRELQSRCGVSCLSRLLALAVLKSWV